MGFLDLFKPKWRHSNADVRAEAVRQLTPDDTAILVQVVKRDADAHVRRLALKKIDDADVLLDIAHSDSDEGLRKAAQDKADDLLLAAALAATDAAAAEAALSKLGQRALLEAARRAQRPEVRRAAADHLGDDKALAELVRLSEDAPLRVACLARIRSEAALRDVAIAAPVKDIGLKALERIRDPELLRDVAERARGKALRAAAQRRLGDAPPAPRRRGPAPEAVQEKQRRAQLLTLCQRAEAAARGADLQRAAADLAAARAAFEALGEEPGDEPLRKRLEQATAQLRERAAAAQRQAEEAQRQAEEVRRAREVEARRAALCERVEKLDGDSLPAQLLEARAAWSELGPPQAGSERELAQRFARAVKDAMRRHEQADSRRGARARLGELVAEIEALQGPGAHRRLRSLEQRWHELEAVLPPEDELRPRYERAVAEVRRRESEAREQRRTEAEAAKARLLELCARLEALCEGADRKRAAAALKEAQGSFKEISRLAPADRDAVGERLRVARDRLVIRVHELREEEDWKRWASVPQAEQLCVRVEALRAQLGEAAAEAEAPAEATPAAAPVPLAVLQRELAAARAAWKKLGPLPREKSEALWQRFSAAADVLSAHLGERRAALGAEREENLRRKEALCQQAEALAESTEWKEAAEQLKRLQAEWRNVGSTRRAEGDALWRRFRAACDRFFDRRKEHSAEHDKERAENAQHLVTLCQRAEALAESVDWRGAADQLKRLQVEWKEVGPAPKAESEALWRRFRAACDRFFERRKAHFNELEAERSANLQKKEALCLEVEQLFESEEMGEQEAQEAVREYMARWKAVGPVPKERSDALWERFRTACDKLMLRQWLPPDLEPARFENRPLSGLAERLGASHKPDKPEGEGA